MTDEKLIKVLSKIEELSDWVKLIDDVISGRNNLMLTRNEIPIELLERINYLLEQNIELKLEGYYQALLEVYKKVDLNNANGEKLYLFHFLFSSIKPIKVSHAFLIKQLLNETLYDVQYDKINLHASLISSLRSYALDQNYAVKTYLLNSSKSIINPMVFNSSLSYLRKKDEKDFFSFIDKILDREIAIPDKFYDHISNNLDFYVAEQGDTFGEIYFWYNNIIESLAKKKEEDSYHFEKPARLAKLDMQIRTWLNYQFDNITEKPYGMLLMTLVNIDFPLPLKHYEILEEVESKLPDKQKGLIEDIVEMQFKLFPSYTELYGVMQERYDQNFVYVRQERLFYVRDTDVEEFANGKAIVSKFEAVKQNLVVDENFKTESDGNYPLLISHIKCKRSRVLSEDSTLKIFKEEGAEIYVS